MSKSIRFSYGITMTESKQLAVFPVARVIIRTKQNEELALIMLIDSGATVSALPKSIATLLGINLKKGKPLRIFGVGGKSIRAWQHSIPIRIGIHGIELPVAFLNSSNSPRVLGREGIFDNFTIVFEESRRQSALLETNSSEAKSLQSAISQIPLSE
jgi:hypothetical protein